jgi:hypothetical protein
MAVTFLTDKDGEKLRQQIGLMPNCHAEYFDITDDGELSLKPEYRGDTSNESFTNSVSDKGAGVVGSCNDYLPTDLVIPEMVNEIAVDKLCTAMFFDNKRITSLTFPDTVFEIPDEFCNQAYNLHQINNTEHIRKIGARAFRRCSFEKAIFPNLEENGSLAFSFNGHLYFIDLGKVTKIEDKTFKCCSGLSKVTAKDATSIGVEGLYDTVNLRNVDFISSVTSIGESGVWRSRFEYDWDSLNNCTFGDYATYIQSNPDNFWSGVATPVCENPLPTQLCQRDERWADRDIANNRRYGDSGCTTMCAMHTYCGLNNLELSSVIEFENIVKAVNPELWNTQKGTMATLIPMLQGIGLSASWYTGWDSEKLTTMYETLNNGGYAMVEVGSPSGHIIVVYGVNEKGELLCLDSEAKWYDDTSVPDKYSLPFHKLVCNTARYAFVTR